MFWVYKCNSDQGTDGDSGDWAVVFATTNAQPWGSTKWVPKLSEARVGDTVIAYQTDRNELVGVARVISWQRRGKFKELILKPVRKIGVRVRPLKAANRKVARIPALQRGSGSMRTLYKISREDALTLFKAAGARIRTTTSEPEENAERTLKGAGFGTLEQNKQVERAAVQYMIRHYRAQRWTVSDVSRENRGYDLVCKRTRQELHVEVKGARGEGQQFLITARELSTWSNDERFTLAFVREALSATPMLSLFRGPAARAEFEFRPLSYMVTQRPNPSPHTDARGRATRAGGLKR